MGKSSFKLTKILRNKWGSIFVAYWYNSR